MIFFKLILNMMIRTWLNFEPTEDEIRVVPYPPSLTIPDQSLTIRQIIDRFSRGQDLNVMHSVYYDGEEGEVDLMTLIPLLILLMILQMLRQICRVSKIII